MTTGKKGRGGGEGHLACRGLGGLPPPPERGRKKEGRRQEQENGRRLAGLTRDSRGSGHAHAVPPGPAVALAGPRRMYVGGWWAGRVGEWGAQCLPFYTRFAGAWTNTAEEEERGRRRPSRRAHVPAARRRRSPREGEWVEGVGLVGGCRGGGWVGGRWMCASVSFARGGGGGKQQCPPEPWGWAWKGERQDDEGTRKGGGRGVLLPLAPGALGAGRGRVCGAQVNATKGGRDSPGPSRH